MGVEQRKKGPLTAFKNPEERPSQCFTKKMTLDTKPPARNPRNKRQTQGLWALHIVKKNTECSTNQTAGWPESIWKKKGTVVPAPKSRIGGGTRTEAPMEWLHEAKRAPGGKQNNRKKKNVGRGPKGL